MRYEYDIMKNYLKRFKGFEYRQCGKYMYLINDIITIKIVFVLEIRFFYKEKLIATKDTYLLNREQTREQIRRCVKIARKLTKRNLKRRII